MQGLDLELAAERDRLYVAIEPDLLERIDDCAEFDRVWSELAIVAPQMAEKFEYAQMMEERLGDDINENDLDDFIADRIWRYKVAQGKSAFASPIIGRLLLGFDWLNSTPHLVQQFSISRKM